MKTTILLILSFISISAMGQKTTEWINSLEHPKYKEYELKTENVKADFLRYNFSTLLIPRDRFLGYVGADFERIRIVYTSVEKDVKNPEVYLIKGIDIVGKNKSTFSGKITVEQVREYKSMHYGVDGMYRNRGLKSEGIMIGNYEFEENPNHKYSGIFKGIMTLNWYVDKYGILRFDDIEIYSDDYRNNQYVGSWTEYNSKLKKVCNWGGYRIPFSGDLDIGAGDFSPDPKYYDEGWSDFKNE